MGLEEDAEVPFATTNPPPAVGLQENQNSAGSDHAADSHHAAKSQLAAGNHRTSGPKASSEGEEWQKLAMPPSPPKADEDAFEKEPIAELQIAGSEVGDGLKEDIRKAEVDLQKLK